MRPASREVFDWKSAEANAVAWIRWLGHADAHLTRAGADGGVDVAGLGLFAQVKWYGKPVGTAPMRQLHGARGRRPGTLYFFSNAGYSAPARRYAEEVQIAAFTYSTSTGAITPVTSAARTVYEASERRDKHPAAQTFPAGSRPSGHRAPPPDSHPPGRRSERPIVEYVTYNEVGGAHRGEIEELKKLRGKGDAAARPAT